jgi:hypothetical protein
MTAWSFSSLEQFRNCPKQYQEVRVLKNFKEDDTVEWRVWGNRVHEALSAALTKNERLPPDMDVWNDLIDGFRKLKGRLLTEQQMALTEGFQPCEWFGRNVWVRGVIDALWLRDDGVAQAVDWKTGKRKLNSDQLALFALLVFHHYPQIQEVRTMFVWLKTGQGDKVIYQREQIPDLWQLFMTDVKRLEACMGSNTWVPRTSGLCSEWCPVVTCQYNGKRRNW